MCRPPRRASPGRGLALGQKEESASQSSVAAMTHSGRGIVDTASADVLRLIAGCGGAGGIRQFRGPAKIYFDGLLASAAFTSDREIPNCRAIRDAVMPALKAARMALSLP
jgi:hypothetical protein